MSTTQRIGPSHVLAAAAALAPPMALVASHGMTPLVAVAATGMVATGWRRRPWREMPRLPLVLMAVILAWMAASVLWAIDPVLAARSTLLVGLQVVAGTVVVGGALGLDEDERRRVGRGVLAGLAAGLAYLAVDLATAYKLTRLIHHLPVGVSPTAPAAVISHGITVEVLLLWAGLLALARLGAGRWRMAALVVAVAVPTFLLHTLEAKVAIVAGLVLMVVARRLARPVGTALAVAVFAAILLAPLAALQIPPPQVSADEQLVPPILHHRLTIWSFVARRIADKPLLGWGMDLSRDLPGGQERITVMLPMGSYREASPEQMLPLHPHDAALQWWVELGGVGALLFAALAAALFRGAGRAAAAALALATVTDGMVASLVSYGFWQSWWLCSLWLAAALVAALGASADA